MAPEAVAAMLPFLTEHFGNPSGSHSMARRAKAALEDARDEAAAALGCRPREVVFTAGGTEADNLAIHGVVARAGGRAACPATEHHAVLHATQAAGGQVLPVGADGRLDPEILGRALSDGDVAVVSVMLVNNEVGTIEELAPLAEVIAQRSPTTVLHTDAVQAFHWLDVAALAECAGLVALSGHKFGGPKGVGVLVVRDGVAIAPILHGGGQEQDRRSGTHNVAGIVGMAAAMTAAVAARRESAARVAPLRDRLLDTVLAAVPGAVETGDRSAKAPGHAHLRFPGVESETLLFLLDEAGVCASAGSACASGALEPSHVLLAMGVSPDDAATSLRLTLGSSTTDADVDVAAKAVAGAVTQLRGR